jgi:hypothetical protein
MVAAFGEVAARRLEHLVEEQPGADAVDVWVHVADLVARRQHEEEERVPEPAHPRGKDQVIVPDLQRLEQQQQRTFPKLDRFFQSYFAKR